MNFKNKSQSINNYFDKLYDRMIRDSTMISEWNTLVKTCKLEQMRLSNYATAIKEEIATELRESPSYLELDERQQKGMLATIEHIHQQLVVPEFAILQEDCMEEVVVDTQANDKTYSNRQTDTSFLNKGTPIGAAVGLGIGLVTTKNFPLLLLATLGGAVVGSLVGKSVGQSRSRRSTLRATTGTSRVKTKFNQRKFEFIVQQRKASILTLFIRYLEQLEGACDPILK